MNNLTIQRLDGTTYDLKELGIITKYFRPLSPSLSHVTTKLDGRDGSIRLDSNYDSRKILTSFAFISDSQHDYTRLRNEVFQLFQTREEFYVISHDEKWKRWKVQADSSFSIDRTNLVGEFDLELISYSPFAESTITTLNPYTPEGIYQVSTSSNVQYRFNTTTFSVWNDGNVKVDPRMMSLKIQFSGLTNNLSIKNLTNGDEWKYTGITFLGETYTLDGIRSLKNGLSVFKNTNRKLISLEPGWNEFQLTGATSLDEISFDFRFYYI